MIVHDRVDRLIKMSGTAIIRFYYRLRQQPEAVFVYLETKSRSPHRIRTLSKRISFKNHILYFGGKDYEKKNDGSSINNGNGNSNGKRMRQ